MQTYFEIEVSLMDITPRIWRRFLISTTANFRDLHTAIRDAFGWDGGHLWEFKSSRRGDAIAGVPPASDPWLDSDPVPDAKKVRLTDFFAVKPGVQKCLYVYDFEGLSRSRPD